MRETPLGGLGTDGGAGGNCQREWGTQEQRHEAGKRCVQGMAGLLGCSGQSLGNTKGK